MKQILVLLTAALAVFISGSASAQKYEMGQTFVGRILDRTCAIMHVAGAHPEVNTLAECTERSARPDYVFYDPETQMTYELADQQKSAKFAGQAVRLVGYVNNSSRYIEASEITPIP